MPEYCKKVRSKELKPRSNYRTRRKSLDLAEETTPRHRANDVVVDDADIEGPRDEATLKGTACLKKVLGVVVAVEVVGSAALGSIAATTATTAAGGSSPTELGSSSSVEGALPPRRSSSRRTDRHKDFAGTTKHAIDSTLKSQITSG